MSAFSGKYDLVVVGASAGGVDALAQILSALPRDFGGTILVVQHIAPQTNLDWMVGSLQDRCLLSIFEAEANMSIFPPKIIFAPPNYHLLVEKSKIVSLDTGEKRNFSRPSIDMLFESAADAFTSKLIGVILTGANDDGAEGLQKIRSLGGYAVVQDPATAIASEMPEAAIRVAGADDILPLEQIGPKLTMLCGQKWS
ncbi:MAG: chemotaxis protein CheB [Oligoflexales bacterium]